MKIECRIDNIYFSAKHIIMNIIHLLSSLVVISQFIQIDSQNSMDRPLLMVRNQYLRFYIYTKRDSIHNRIGDAVPVIKSCLLSATDSIKDKTNRIYNKILSKYYDVQAAYYSLPPEDIELIEQIINLHF